MENFIFKAYLALDPIKPPKGTIKLANNPIIIA
jgi:hypothetical protein